MQFYASKYGVSVYHATNGKESGVIKPKEKFVQKIILNTQALKKINH